MMKSSMYLLPILGIFTFSCAGSLSQAQVPDPVKSGFETNFQGARATDWEKEGENFEVEFSLNSLEQEALIDPAGRVLLVKNDIPETELPEAVSSTIRQQYSGMAITDAEKLQQGGQVLYQVELKKEDQELQLVFNTDGQEQTAATFWD